LRRAATTAVQRTADEGALPYDAAVAADVRIGRKPWTHTLTQRTFTFAHVYGEIQQIAIEPWLEQGGARGNRGRASRRAIIARCRTS
jgi:hypothetical protein